MALPQENAGPVEMCAELFQDRLNRIGLGDRDHTYGKSLHPWVTLYRVWIKFVGDGVDGADILADLLLPLFGRMVEEGPAAISEAVASAGASTRGYVSEVYKKFAKSHSFR